MAVLQDTSWPKQYPCVHCGYTLQSTVKDRLCPECGQAARPSIDRHNVREGIKQRSTMSLTLAILSFAIPFLQLVAIYIGYQALRDGRAQEVYGKAQMFAVAGIVLAVLSAFVFLFIVTNVLFLWT